MLTIEAKFKGKNGSMGFENGWCYRLFFWTQPNKVFIQQPGPGPIVPYDSLKAFLKNWEIL